MITPEQIKAARALLRMEQEELARRAGVSVTTIRRIEAAGDYSVAEDTQEEVRMALHEAGVEFIFDGVRMRRQDADKGALFQRLYALAEKSAAELAGTAPYGEADLYGEDGLPA
jgi:transcriptional regulator with XRE-family HTH domain